MHADEVLAPLFHVLGVTHWTHPSTYHAYPPHITMLNRRIATTPHFSRLVTIPADPPQVQGLPAASRIDTRRMRTPCISARHLRVPRARSRPDTHSTPSSSAP